MRALFCILAALGQYSSFPSLGEMSENGYVNFMSMNSRNMEKKLPFRPVALGIPERLIPVVLDCARQLEGQGVRGKALRRLFIRLAQEPRSFEDHPVLGGLAGMLGGGSSPGPAVSVTEVPWRAWGEDLDPKAVRQLRDGCGLPVAVCGALMPDAHVGYGLPIGGVLAVSDAVIPYGVGMDIACRMKMSVFAVSPDLVDTHDDELAQAIEQETCFGVGGQFKVRKDHAVIHEDWGFSPVTQRMRDTAWAQLGTSGSGNHFVEWGVLDVPGAMPGLPEGTYLALLSHSGSRGTGGEVAKHYSALARRLHPELPRALGHLAWLGFDTDEGREYWAAMELMGRYSAANHALIHAAVAGSLGLTPLFGIENHHNFAWREIHGGREVIVHRKGATPAGRDVFGIIPGTMVDPAFVVEGLGNPMSLCSAAHGAGRVMSRKEALARFRRSDLEHVLRERGVRLLSGGLDEVPMAYKDIREVMAAQADLVRIRGTFLPRIVKMAK
jgi:tRNA-splicing ligase RtcB